jgi:hypothetical protein
VRKVRSDRGRPRPRDATPEQLRVVALKEKTDPDTGKPFTDAAIAEELGISAAAVKMRRYRFRLKTWKR